MPACLDYADAAYLHQWAESGPETSMNITLPDGAVREYAPGTTGAEIAASISKSLARKAVAMTVDGALRDLHDPVEHDAEVRLLTRDDEEALDLIRHDAAHVMAEAVQSLYPGTQVTIGPVIKDGFFYDFYRETPFTTEDLPRIEARMREMTGRSQREQIGINIADAVTSILPVMKENIDWMPVVKHKVGKVQLTRRHISHDDIYTARGTWHKPQVETVPEAFDRLLAEYKKRYQELEEHPELKKKKNWYVPISKAYWRLMRASVVMDRYKLERSDPSLEVEVHVIRIGDMAIATNPFELYVDFGMQIKARSKSVQTFVVQLAGEGSYLPTHRAVAGGDYGAIPQSNLVGPEGGRQLVNQTLALIDSLWEVGGEGAQLGAD